MNSKYTEQLKEHAKNVRYKQNSLKFRISHFWETLINLFIKYSSMSFSNPSALDF